MMSIKNNNELDYDDLDLIGIELTGLNLIIIY